MIHTLCIRGLKSAELSALVIWLLEQCGSPETSYRQQCVILLEKFASLLPGEHYIGLVFLVSIIWDYYFNYMAYKVLPRRAPGSGIYLMLKLISTLLNGKGVTVAPVLYTMFLTVLNRVGLLLQELGASHAYLLKDHLY